MRVVLLDNDQVLKDLKLDAESISIGSDAAGQVHLPDLAIALEHARLLRNPTGQWMVEAVQIDRPMQVNGRDVDQRCPVYNGDELAIDRFRLKLAIDPGTDLGIAGRSSLDELAEIKNYPLPPGSEVRRPQDLLAIPAEQFQRLARYAEEIAGCGRVADLADLTLTTVLESLTGQFAWSGLRPQPAGPLETVEGRTERGATARPPQAVESLQYRCLERSQAILIARKKSQAQQSALAVPLVGARGRFGLLYVEAKPEEHRYTMHHLDILLGIAAFTGHKLESLLLAGATLDGLHTESIPSPPAQGGQHHAGAGVQPVDTPPTIAPPPGPAPAGSLDPLRAIQIRLNAKKAPTWPGYQLGIHWRPGKERGGDLYDAMTLPNGMGSLLMAHVRSDLPGTQVALAQARAAFRVAGLHGDPPRTLLRELDWLAGNIEGNCVLSVAHTVFNPKTGAMEFGAAGGVEAVIVDTKGQVRALADGDGEPLGLSESAEVPRCTERLAKGELLAVLSPGYRTLCESSGTPLSRAQWVEVLRSGVGEAPSGLLEDLHQDLAAFFRDGRQPDDITVLLLRRT
ncbi:MAG: SpoIIE family protein phosphatase [Phycisphaerae bacterium]